MQQPCNNLSQKSTNKGLTNFKRAGVPQNSSFSQEVFSSLSQPYLGLIDTITPSRSQWNTAIENAKESLFTGLSLPAELVLVW
jgi:hypothetical protein